MEVLTRGLAVAGTLTRDGFEPWACDVTEAIARVAADWIAWGESPPTPGAIMWLELTSTGRQLGEQVLARESQRE